MKANCVVCGKEFEKHGNFKTCGQQCCKQLRRENKRKNNLASLEKESDRSRMRRVARRRECSRKRGANNRVKAICSVCGKEFEKRGKMKTCGKRCSYKLECDYKRKWSANRAKNIKINCIVCGKQFRKSRAQKTCGKQCSAEWRRIYKCEYRAVYREKFREWNRKYSKANPEKIRERGSTYRKANPAKRKGYSQKYYHSDISKSRERAREYRAAHPEVARKGSRKYSEANPEKIRERSRKYRANNLEKVRERNRNRERSVNAVKALGISVPEYALSQMIKRLTQSQEQPNDQASDQSV